MIIDITIVSPKPVRGNENEWFQKFKLYLFFEQFC